MPLKRPCEAPKNRYQCRNHLRTLSSPRSHLRRLEAVWWATDSRKLAVSEDLLVVVEEEDGSVMEELGQIQGLEEVVCCCVCLRQQEEKRDQSLRD